MQYQSRFSNIFVAVTFIVATMGMISISSPQPLEAKMEGSLSGNVGFTSKYIFRGAIEDQNAMQGGIDYSHPGGYYAGYWTSTLNYGNSGGAVENDIYAGFSGELDNGISYDIGGLAYLYTNEDVAMPSSDTNAGESSDAGDIYVNLSKGPFSLGAALAVEDATWTNSGDIYYSASYSTDLSYGFGFSTKVGYYSYDGDNQNLSGDDSGLSDVVVALNHPIGDSGADMHLKYVHIGEDRNDGNSLNRDGGATDDQQIVVGATYNFDITDSM